MQNHRLVPQSNLSTKLGSSWQTRQVVRSGTGCDTLLGAGLPTGSCAFRLGFAKQDWVQTLKKIYLIKLEKTHKYRMPLLLFTLYQSRWSHSPNVFANVYFFWILSLVLPSTQHFFKQFSCLQLSTTVRLLGDYLHALASDAVNQGVTQKIPW